MPTTRRSTRTDRHPCDQLSRPAARVHADGTAVPFPGPAGRGASCSDGIALRRNRRLSGAVRSGGMTPGMTSGRWQRRAGQGWAIQTALFERAAQPYAREGQRNRSTTLERRSPHGPGQGPVHGDRCRRRLQQPSLRALVHRRAAELDTARQAGHVLFGRLQELAGRFAQAQPETLAHAMLGEAELTRLEDEPSPARWAAAVLRQAHQSAAGLGAAPLQREIERLARRARIDLTPVPARIRAGPPAEPSPAERLGPTRREREVLGLLVAGRTNRQIANTLFISVKTVGIHVSNILAKLGVASRGEAAALAHRGGLVDDPPDDLAAE